MVQENHVLAVACSDIHLRHTMPVSRNEDNWYDAMDRMLSQITQLHNEVCEEQRDWSIPLLCAGDIFDRWNPGPELINFAIRKLTKGFRLTAIPGQHDLPYHSMELIRKSAFWTLVESNVVNIGDGFAEYWPCDDLCLHLFPWGSEVSSEGLERVHKELHVALIHGYIGTPKHSYPGAPKTSMVSGWKKKIEGFDIAIFGDNHQAFISRAGKCKVVNCGCILRNKADEQTYRPAVYLIYTNGDVKPVRLDVSEDKWKAEEIPLLDDEVSTDLSEFISELEELGSDSLDFRDAVNTFLNDNKVESKTRKIILDSMEV